MKLKSHLFTGRQKKRRTDAKAPLIELGAVQFERLLSVTCHSSPLFRLAYAWARSKSPCTGYCFGRCASGWRLPYQQTPMPGVARIIIRTLFSSPPISIKRIVMRPLFSTRQSMDITI